MEAANWLAIILAVIMATPPLIAQLLDGIQKGRTAASERKAQMATEDKTAVEEWKNLYNQCAGDKKAADALNEVLETKNDALKAENASLKVENATLKLALEAIQKIAAETKEEVVNMRAEIVDLKNEIGTLNGTVTELRRELEWVKKERDAAELEKRNPGPLKEGKA